MNKVNEIKCNSLEETVDTMLKMLEESDSTWVKSWSTLNSKFKNYVNNKPYTCGTNIFALWTSLMFQPTILGQKRSLYYVTSKQAFELGGKLKSECKNWSKENQARRTQIEELRKERSNETDIEKIKQINEKIIELRKEIKLHTIWEDIIFYQSKYYQIVKKDDKYYRQDLKYVNGDYKVVSEKEVSEEYVNNHQDAIDKVEFELSTRYYTVAPIEYFDGLKKIKGRELELERFDTKKTSKDLWNCLNDYYNREKIKVIEKDSNEAYYDVIKDSITIPSINQFKTEADALDVVSHETMHSTGAKIRLNRDMTGDFASSKYAKEELVAEMGSFFFMLESGKMTDDILKNKLAYIKGYLNRVRENNMTNNLISCINNGRKAFEYVIQPDEDYGGDYED